MPIPAISELFAAFRVLRVGDREVVSGVLLPGLGPDDPAVRRALAAWPGTHWLVASEAGWEAGLERRILPPRRERWWLHALLLALTLLSATLAGAYLAGRDPLRLAADGFLPVPTAFAAGELASGLPFALPLVSILLAHELGHYLAARAHGLDVSPPYFIPAPFFVSLIGTFGAFIRLRSPLLHRRVLLDVGAAGPLAGLVLAIPVSLAGLWMSTPFQPQHALPPLLNAIALPGEMPLAFGNSLLWLAMRSLFAAPSSLLVLHPVALAGWVGLFFTAMNLLPAAQLDGGHILYALVGARWQGRVAAAFFASLLVLGWWWKGWWVWAVLILLVGRGRLAHPPVLEPRLPLTRGRRIAGWICVTAWVLVFAPVPIR